MAFSRPIILRDVLLLLLSLLLGSLGLHAQAQRPKAKVDITFNGKVVTGQTQTIMTGQPVTLDFAVSGGPQVRRWQWLVPFTVVGGFEASPESSKVIPPDFAKRRQHLHWIDQGPAKTVWLLYGLNNGEQGRISTTFNVQGPTNVKVTTQTGRVKIFNGGTEAGLGEGTAKSVGIIFTAGATRPSAGSGQFIWVQLINSDEFYYTGPKGLNLSDRSTGGLDLGLPDDSTARPVDPKRWWYDKGPTTNDSPGHELGSGQGIDRMSRQFTATMFLMWQADAPNSIPVPLGSVVWYTGWYLVFVPKSNPPWTIKGSFVLPHRFAPSIQYPVWKRRSKIIDVP